MLARNVNQVLIFGQNHEFGYGCFDSIPPDAPVPSSHLTCYRESDTAPSISITGVLKHRGMLGSVCLLRRGGAPTTLHD